MENGNGRKTTHLRSARQGVEEVRDVHVTRMQLDSDQAINIVEDTEDVCVCHYAFTLSYVETTSILELGETGD